MLSLFRTNQILATVFVLIFAALPLAAPLLEGARYSAGEYGIFFHYLNRLLDGNARSAWIASLIFLFLGAFVANLIDQRFRLSRDINMMPGLFYALISCTVPFYGLCSPLYAANFFLLLSIHELMDTFKKNAVAGAIFNAGFFLALSSFFYPSYLIFLFLIFIGLNLMRGFDLRERLMAVVGLVVPYILLGTTALWLDQFTLFWQLQVTQAFAWLDIQQIELSLTTILAISVLILLLLALVFQQGELTGKRVIQSQKRINLLYWALLMVALAVPIQAQLQWQHLLMLAPGAGVLAGVYFSSMSRNLAEFLFIVWFALVMVLHFQNFIFPG